jgi:hypothetical protein
MIEYVIESQMGSGIMGKVGKVAGKSIFEVAVLFFQIIGWSGLTLMWMLWVFNAGIPGIMSTPSTQRVIMMTVLMFSSFLSEKILIAFRWSHEKYLNLSRDIPMAFCNLIYKKLSTKEIETAASDVIDLYNRNLNEKQSPSSRVKKYIENVHERLLLEIGNLLKQQQPNNVRFSLNVVNNKLEDCKKLFEAQINKTKKQRNGTTTSQLQQFAVEKWEDELTMVVCWLVYLYQLDIFLKSFDPVIQKKLDFLSHLGQKNTKDLSDAGKQKYLKWIGQKSQHVEKKSFTKSVYAWLKLTTEKPTSLNFEIDETFSWNDWVSMIQHILFCGHELFKLSSFSDTVLNNMQNLDSHAFASTYNQLPSKVGQLLQKKWQYAMQNTSFSTSSSASSSAPMNELNRRLSVFDEDADEKSNQKSHKKSDEKSNLKDVLLLRKFVTDAELLTLEQLFETKKVKNNDKNQKGRKLTPTNTSSSSSSLTAKNLRTLERSENMRSLARTQHNDEEDDDASSIIIYQSRDDDNKINNGLNYNDKLQIVRIAEPIFKDLESRKKDFLIATNVVLKRHVLMQFLTKYICGSWTRVINIYSRWTTFNDEVTTQPLDVYNSIITFTTVQRNQIEKDRKDIEELRKIYSSMIYCVQKLTACYDSLLKTKYYVSAENPNVSKRLVQLKAIVDVGIDDHRYAQECKESKIELNLESK